MMFKTIERTDAIFKSELFTKDAIAFNVVFSIVQNKEKYPDPKCFSNGTDCIIVNSGSKWPVIVWTSDSFNDYEKVWVFVKQEFRTNNPFKIMSKKPLYDFLVNLGNANPEKALVLGVYKCDKLKDIEYKGKADNATESEFPLLVDLVAQFETDTGEGGDADAREEAAKAYISSSLNKAWRNPDGKIVAIAKVNETEEYGRLGQIVTLPEERGKSYAKMLVHFLTKQVLDLGKTPMLFTDFSYEPSNKCYTGAGYELIGTIVNYDISI